MNRISTVTIVWFLVQMSAYISQAMAQESAVAPGTVNEKRAQDVSDFLTFRDPFLPPDLGDAVNISRLALERFPVSDFKLLGVMSGPLKKRAMIQGPDGKSYVVSEQMKLGVRSGVVNRITTNSIIVREQIVNAIGQQEFLDVELTLDRGQERSSGGG